MLKASKFKHQTIVIIFSVWKLLYEVVVIGRARLVDLKRCYYQAVFPVCRGKYDRVLRCVPPANGGIRNDETTLVHVRV